MAFDLGLVPAEVHGEVVLLCGLLLDGHQGKQPWRGRGGCCNRRRRRVAGASAALLARHRG
eukprot:5452621-Prorocentrum_lima.AAC.1